MSTILLESSIIECNLTEILLEFIFIKNKLWELRNIQEEDKLTIWDNKLYIESMPYYIQPITRLLTGQNRYYIQEYLHREFKEYNKILDKIDSCLKVIPQKHAKYQLLKQLLDKNLFFIKNILPGLYLIKKSYEKNPPNINTYINPIIYRLTLFKNRYDTVRKEK